MPQAPGLGLHAPGELDLGQPLLEQVRQHTADPVRHGSRGADAVDLPGGLDRALPDDRPADVLEGRLREELLEAPESRHRQHVELEAQSGRQRVVPLLDRRRQTPEGRERDHVTECRFEASTRGDLEHEQRRPALHRHVEIRLLDGAGVVVEVGVLLQERRVETKLRKAGLQTGDAALQFRGRRQDRCRLEETRARRAHVTPGS